MASSDNQINFTLSADERAFVESCRKAGVSIDNLKEKVKGLADATASDRQINKALGQDTIGDFLEGFGIGEKGLAAIKAGGMALFGLQAAASAASKILNGLADDKPMSRIYQDVVESIPIIGGVAKTFDELGTAIGRYAYGLDDLQAQEKRENEALKERLQLVKDIATAGKQARDQMFVSSSPDATVASAILEYSDTSTKTAEQRKRLLGMGKDQISNEARAQALKDLADQEDAAALKVFNAQMTYEKRLRDEAEQTAKERQRLTEETARKEVEAQKKAEQEKKNLAEEAQRAKDEANRIQMAGSARLLQEIGDIQKDLSSGGYGYAQRTAGRIGAMPTGLGIGLASSLASRERQSFEPLVKLAKEAEKRDIEKLKYLKGLYEKSQRGEVSLVDL